MGTNESKLAMYLHEAAAEVSRLRALVEGLRKDAERLQWALPLLTGVDTPEVDSRTNALGNAVYGGLQGREAIDDAMGEVSASPAPSTVAPDGGQT